MVETVHTADEALETAKEVAKEIDTVAVITDPVDLMERRNPCL